MFNLFNEDQRVEREFQAMQTTIEKYGPGATHAVFLRRAAIRLEIIMWLLVLLVLLVGKLSS